MEIITIAQYMGYIMEQNTINFPNRIFGESKLGANEIVSYIKGLMDFYFEKIYSNFFRKFIQKKFCQGYFV